MTEPADAMATILMLRAERDQIWQANLRLISERDRLRRAIAAATDPDAILAAMDDVHDMDVSLSDYAAAVSSAIRAAIEGTPT